MDKEKPVLQDKNSALPTKTVVMGVVCVVIILAVALLVKTCWQAPADALQSVAEAPGKGADELVNVAFRLVDGMKERLNITPSVIQDTQILIQESTPTLELATVTRRVTVELGYTNNWLGSEKILRLQGTFLAKGGFNLRKHCELRVLPEQGKIVAIFPDPEVLSVEMVSHEILFSEGGYWNKLKHEDQKIVMDQLYAKARQNAAGAVLGEASKELENVIFELAKSVGADVEVRYGINEADLLKSPRG